MRARGCAQIQTLLRDIAEGLKRSVRNPQRVEVGERISEGLQRIQAIAMVLLHRFFTYSSVRAFREDPGQLTDVVAACCFLGCKLEDIEMRASFVTEVLWKEQIHAAGAYAYTRQILHRRFQARAFSLCVAVPVLANRPLI